MNLGPTELVIILVIALIVFGPRKLPDLGKTLGQAMSQFRRASDDFKRSWEQEVEIEKTRLSDIKQDVGSGLAFDSAGEDFNYSMDPNRGESATSEPETTTVDPDGNATQETELAQNGSEQTGEGTLTPEPATATVARSTARTEPWI